MNEGMKTCGKPSRGRYAMGCRCFMCRQANSEYEYRRTHGAAGSMVGEFEVEEARAKVERWRSRGIGLREIEFWTGVSRTALETLANGSHRNCNGASRRMKRENYEAIMGADIKGRAPGALVRSEAALSAVDSMRRAGWTFAEMSERSGVNVGTLHSLAYRRPARVTQRVNDALCRAWRERNRKRGPSLEEWQWQEARHDYQHGTASKVLAERYGVSEKTLNAHMREHGIVWASAC